MDAKRHETPALRRRRNKREAPRRGRRGGGRGAPRRRSGALAGLLLTAYLGALAANRSLVEVRGPSMLPALWPGDRVLTVPALGRLRPGQVVVVRDPDAARHLAVKRVHAIDADGVDVRGDHPDASTDSRTWGPLRRRAVRRRAVRRWPDLRTRL